MRLALQSSSVPSLVRPIPREFCSPVCDFYKKNHKRARKKNVRLRRSRKGLKFRLACNNHQLPHSCVRSPAHPIISKHRVVMGKSTKLELSINTSSNLLISFKKCVRAGNHMIPAKPESYQPLKSPKRTFFVLPKGAVFLPFAY